MEQKTIITDGNYSEIEQFIIRKKIHRVMLVCGKSFKSLKIAAYIEDLGNKTEICVFFFQDFEPNPRFESVVSGVRFFQANKCDAVFAIGGGSAMDVAKCVKLYAMADPDDMRLCEMPQNHIPMLAMPTTAGTGSEATCFAVIYVDGEKKSVCHESCYPDFVVLDAGVLEMLPLYQKKSTAMDAMCHAVESYWSVNSNDESKSYSGQAVRLILRYMDDYLRGDRGAAKKMLSAANMAGKAINITKTTAGHAMCYKLTSLFGISHGHAAAVCVSKLWPYMISHIDRCCDNRGKEYLKAVFDGLAELFDEKDAQSAAVKFEELVEKMGLYDFHEQPFTDYDNLVASVNLERLKNNPVFLNEDDIMVLYHQILDFDVFKMQNSVLGENK